jgi:predicted secreted protein
MATTGIVNGTKLKISIAGTAVAYTTNATVDLAMATRDASSKDSLGWREVKEGQLSGTISGDFLHAFDSSYGFEDLFAAMIARTAVTIKYATTDAADKAIEGSGYLTSLSQSSPMEDTVTGAFTLEFTGAITYAT